MRLKKLILKGAIGIQRGLGLDEVEIDFEKFSSGLLAFTGENGAGKTTVLENLIPFRTMVSRDGPLYSHFFLKNSLRDLSFSMNGAEYRCLLKIDAPAKKMEAYLYRNGELIDETKDGLTTPYDEEITKLLGNKELFFKSIFSGQNCDKISDLPKGDKKKLFVEMLGLEKYEAYATKAKEKAKELEEQNIADQTKMEMIKERLQTEPELKSRKKENEKQLVGLENQLKQAQKELQQVESQKKVIETKMADQKVVQSQILALQQKIEDLKKQIITAENKTNQAKEETTQEIADDQALISRKNKLLENKQLIEEKVAELEDLITAEQKMKKGMAKANELQDQITAVDTKTNKAKEKKSGLEGQIAELKYKIEANQKKGKLLNQVPCADTDLAKQCPLLADAIQANKELTTLERKSKVIQTKLLEISDFETLTKEKKTLEKKKSQAYDFGKHQALSEQIIALQEKKWPYLQIELEQAEETIKSLQKRIKTNQLKVEKLEADFKEEKIGLFAETEKSQKEIIEKGERIDLTLDEKLAEITEEMATKQKDIDEVQNERFILSGQLKSFEDQLGELIKLKAELAEITDKTKQAKTEIAEWRLLQQACGKDGIQALEIDNAGPGVSRIANSLLSSCFGSEFQISFETTKLSADQKKVLEIFDIVIWRDGEPMTIENLSGGQRVWLERALSIAFATYIRENASKQFETYFLDEEDGALDEENRQRYLEMLQAAHQLTRMWHTILISQSQQLTDSIPQRLELGSWGIRQVY